MYKWLVCAGLFCCINEYAVAQSINDSANAVQLQNVDILSDLKRYSRDSVDMARTYKKVYEDATRRPTKSIFGNPSPIGLSVGMQYEGLISSFARKISGRQKTDKRFVADFKRTQAEKYIMLKYNPEIVSSVIQLIADSILAFIRMYPMEESYARAASPLEIKMWIRK